jgi:hypothetical protein
VEFVNGTPSYSRIGVVNDICDENYNDRQLLVRIQFLDDRVHTRPVLMMLIASRPTLHNGIGIIEQKNGKPLSLEMALNHLAPDLGNVGCELTHVTVAPHA